MGWSSGTTLFREVINTTKAVVKEHGARMALYRGFIAAFEDADWDNLDEVMGIDDAYDEVVRLKYHENFEEGEITMGWKISEIENTVVIPDGAIRDLNEILPAYVEGIDDFVYPDGTLYLDGDASEHADWITVNDEVCTILAATGATGRICFGCLDADQKDQFWGIEFASGRFRKLTGSVTWEEDKSPNPIVGLYDK